MPKVSVVVPVYNVERYVERCVRSLFEQTLDDIEYVFVDDCTPDNSVEVIKKVLREYPHRLHQVKFIHHLVNKGLTAARNSGLELATGDYIAHCDSDDWVSLNMYESLLKRAEQTNADVVYCNFYMAYLDAMVEHSNLEVINDRTEYLQKYMTTAWTSIWNLIAKKRLYMDNHLESPSNFTYCEDFYLTVKLMFFAEHIEKINTPLYYYNRENENSLLHKDNGRAIKDELMCYTEILTFFDKYGVKDQYIKELSWKILGCSQDWVLNPNYHQVFCDYMPEKNKFILSCPFVNVKIKFMMWLLTHKMRGLVLMLLCLRERKNSLS